MAPVCPKGWSSFSMMRIWTSPLSQEPTKCSWCCLHYYEKNTIMPFDRKYGFRRVLRNIIHKHKPTRSPTRNQISTALSLVPGQLTDTYLSHRGVLMLIDGFHALKPVLIFGVELHDFYCCIRGREVLYLPPAMKFLLLTCQSIEETVPGIL